MKTTSFKKTFLTGLAVVGAFTSLAQAQIVIRIVASNGDRTATQTAISKLLDSGWVYRGINGNTSSSGTLSTATGSNFGAWNGTYSGTAVVIKASYSGALAGIQAVAGDVQQRFVVSDGTGSGSLTSPIAGGAVLGTDYELGVADFGFSTNFQSTSPFNGTYQGVTYSPILEENVGVSPLGFYASPGFPGSPVNPHGSTYAFGTYTPNITTQLARQLYSAGSVSLAQFTGDYANHKNITVWALGRNTDAGQRFGALLEVGFNFTSVVRTWFGSYTVGTGATAQSTGSGTVAKYGGVVGSHVLWPVATQPGAIAVPVGSGGYSSGQLIAEALTATLGIDAYRGGAPGSELYPAATAGYYIGYITPGDANNRLLGNDGNLPAANRGVALSLNGVPLTTANVKNGSYTAWLYNRLIRRSGGVIPNDTTPTVGFKKGFAESLRDQIKNVDAPAGGGFIDDATNQVQRFTDGGDVVPK